MPEKMPNISQEAQKLVTAETEVWLTIAPPETILERLESWPDSIKGPELADALNNLPGDDEQWQDYTRYYHWIGGEMTEQRSPQQEAALALIDAVVISSDETINSFCKRAESVIKTHNIDILFPQLDFLASAKRLVGIEDQSDQQKRLLYPLMELLAENAPWHQQLAVVELARSWRLQRLPIQRPKPEYDPKKESPAEIHARQTYPRVKNIAKLINNFEWAAAEDGYEQIDDLITTLPRIPLENTLRIRLASKLLSSEPENPKATDARHYLDKNLTVLHRKASLIQNMPQYFKSALADELKRRLELVHSKFHLKNLDAESEQELEANLDEANDETLFLKYLFGNLNYSRARSHELLLQAKKNLANDPGGNADVYDYITNDGRVNSIIKTAAVLATLENGPIGAHVFDNVRSAFVKDTSSEIAVRQKARELGFGSHKLPAKAAYCTISDEQQLELNMLPDLKELQAATARLTSWKKVTHEKWATESYSYLAVNLDEIVKFAAIATEIRLKTSGFEITQNSQETVLTSGDLDVRLPEGALLDENGFARIPFTLNAGININKPATSSKAIPGFLTLYGGSIKITTTNPSDAYLLTERFKEIKQTMSPNTDLAKNGWSKTGSKRMSAKELRRYRQDIQR